MVGAKVREMNHVVRDEGEGAPPSGTAEAGAAATARRRGWGMTASARRPTAQPGPVGATGSNGDGERGPPGSSAAPGAAAMGTNAPPGP